MKQFRAMVGAVALLALAACNDKAAETPVVDGNTASGAAGETAPSGRDWSQTITATPQGGFLLGNPDAKVKLLEYASLTCPHCRDFSRDASAALRDNYVKNGQVSWEFRSFALNPIDVSASLLAMCQGPQPFFKLIEQVFEEQNAWVLPYQQLSAEKQNEIAALPQDQQFLGLAKAGGLDNFFRVRGLPSAKAEACLTDRAMVEKIIAIREQGVTEDKVEGTPTFFINGVRVDQPPSWAALEPEIKKALN